MNRPDDTSARDAHLLAALRHAPDRDALPPPTVSAAILARAREQARRRAAPPAWRRMLDAWRLPPHLAAAFGSVAVAAVVGLMWSVDDPAPTGREGPAAEPATLALASSATTPAAAASVASPPAAQQAPRGAHGAAPEPRPPLPGSPAADESSRAEPANARAGAAPAPQGVTEPTAPAPQQLPVLEAPPPAPAAARHAAAAPPGGPGAEAPAARAESLDRAAPTGDRARAAPPSPLPPVPMLGFARPPAARSALAQPRPAASAPSAPSAVSAASAGPSMRASERPTVFDPLERLAVTLDTAGPQALWRHAGGTTAHGAAQQAWWAGLRDATRGRWTRLPDAPAAPPWLELVRPDVRSESGTEARTDATSASLWLEPGDAPALVLRTGSGVWHAPLAPPLPASWQQAVAGW